MAWAKSVMYSWASPEETSTEIGAKTIPVEQSSPAESNCGAPEIAFSKNAGLVVVATLTISKLPLSSGDNIRLRIGSTRMPSEILAKGPSGDGAPDGACEVNAGSNVGEAPRFRY